MPDYESPEEASPSPASQAEVFGCSKDQSSRPAVKGEGHLQDIADRVDDPADTSDCSAGRSQVSSSMDIIERNSSSLVHPR